MIPLLALLAAAGLLLAVTATTARRPSGAVPDFEGYLARWSPRHGGYDPRRSAPLLGWLRLSHAIARPLARRGVLPDVLTLWGLWFGLAVLVVSGAGGRWPLLAGWVLVVSGLIDTLDGCVAVLTDRATRWGYVLDSMADRAADVVYLVALDLAGAPTPVAVTAGVLMFGLEYLRARAGNAGMPEIGVVTVGERATRVILCSAGIFFGGVYAARAALVATIAAWALVAVGAVALVQLGVAVRRTLATAPRG